MEKLLYEDFVFAVNKIAQRIKTFDINSIYPIPRGGLALGLYLSHLTGLPIVDREAINHNTLICDDIADKGETLMPFYLLDCTIATIYYHKQSKVEPDIWIYEKKDDWILFPWETNKSTK